MGASGQMSPWLMLARRTLPGAALRFWSGNVPLDQSPDSASSSCRPAGVRGSEIPKRRPIFVWLESNILPGNALFSQSSRETCGTLCDSLEPQTGTDADRVLLPHPHAVRGPPRRFYDCTS